MVIFNVIFLPMCTYPCIDFTIYNFHLFKEIWNFQKFVPPSKSIPSGTHF